MIASSRRVDFLRTTKPESHAERKGAILKAHPEIKELMTFEYRTKYIVAATVMLQVGMAWLVQSWSWPCFLAAVYIVGATATHSLFLAVHELSHNLGASTTTRNKAISLLANLPIVFPYCATFKPYHMDHHKCLGEDVIDTDIPRPLEAWIINESYCYATHTIKKFLFCLCQIFFYAFRPGITNPDRYPYDRWQLASFICCGLFDAFIWNTVGWNGLLFLLLSIVVAGSIHPCAGHFLAEHYVTEGEAETYSYYGPLNRLTYNVGYHNEHHDFPNIPWSNLPKLHVMAPEFYDNLPQCESWPGLIFNFILTDSLGLYSRLKRTHPEKQK